VLPELVLETARAIAAVQRPDGFIPHTEAGEGDAWNHVEAAMALDVGGLTGEAERAYEWLAREQRSDGSWALTYRAGRADDAGADANFCAYVATGAWHHYLATLDSGFLAETWPVVERALDFTLALQAPGGEIHWARDARGAAWPAALLTSCSCIHLSLRCGLAIAETLGRQRPRWETARSRLAEAIEHRPEAFEPRDRWSMDWYYPVLCGVLEGTAATARLRRDWDRFVVPGLGVRCVADQPWVTVAETCELVLALDSIGWEEEAKELFAGLESLRAPDGAYWTGVTFPDRALWPEERPTWTSGAVLLAADALSGQSRTSGLFRDDRLETVA
jgi:hypothetical protein